MLLYADTPMWIKSQQKKGAKHSGTFAAILLCPSTFTPAIHGNEGGGVVSRCHYSQQRIFDFTVCLQSSFELSLKEIQCGQYFKN